ncbi:hypothetical protein [Herpetosiphon llansteffanensis]|uniref:hypothetical protein n=1 Tax=Herpetosiphon llansteffanensis TaxID=2094568 RepID=UPI0013DF92CA|nr:hypothetical protein [Herpetosiphon llansteffanensis]
MIPERESLGSGAVARSRPSGEADGLYIDATANPVSFENAARLLLANDSIVM